MRICSYIMKTDSGVAPNPFWGFCTLVLCTPNHQGVKLGKGDWIIGTEPRAIGGKLIYAMKVAERIHFHQYFRDNRFQRKKPKICGSWKEKCGDNLYFLDQEAHWRQLPALYHNTSQDIAKDTKYPYAYISEMFHYFGENATEIPGDFSELIRDRHGCKCDHRPEIISGFIEWVHSAYLPGIHGRPRDRRLFTKPGAGLPCSRC